MSLGHNFRRLGLAVLVTGAMMATGAQAGLYSSDFGTTVPGYTPNDDDVYSASLPFAFTFFGASYNAVTVSNNGNIQFGTSSPAYTSSALNTQTAFRGIAAFWSDLDSRSDPFGAIAMSTGGSAVYMKQTTPTEVVFTWDRLGYYAQSYGGRVQFQIVLRDPTAPVPAGEGSVGFFYAGMAGQSDNSGRTAAIGFGDGLSEVNPGEISLFSGLSADTAAFAANRFIWLNVTDAGVPTLPVDPGTPNSVPEPGSLALLGLGLAGLAAIRKRKLA